MKETDGLAGVSDQRYLGGSGNLNYCLKKKPTLIVMLPERVCSLSAKQKEMDLEIYTLCPSMCCKNLPNRFIVIGVLSRAML